MVRAIFNSLESAMNHVLKVAAICIVTMAVVNRVAFAKAIVG